jgi:pullulanase/glycogen debranching enzyme
MLSLGLPMILMGDEVRRTQLGNNNAYCQDNETSWFDWTLAEKHADLHALRQNALRATAAAGLPAWIDRYANLNQLLQLANAPGTE